MRCLIKSILDIIDIHLQLADNFCQDTQNIFVSYFIRFDAFLSQFVNIENSSDVCAVDILPF